jgi:hypothetical protein
MGLVGAYVSTGQSYAGWRLSNFWTARVGWSLLAADSLGKVRAYLNNGQPWVGWSLSRRWAITDRLEIIQAVGCQGLVEAYLCRGQPWVGCGF